MSVSTGGAATISMVDATTANQLGIAGDVFTVEADTSSSVKVRFDYHDLATAAGGAYGSRLRLVSLPACAVTRPADAQCQIQTPLPESVNDTTTASVSATLATASGPAVAANTSKTSSTAGTSSMMVLAAVADTSGSQGSWTATPLASAGSWASGDSSGAFSYSYQVQVPAAAGPAPSVTLGYSSQAVDGRIASSNNQSSWIGQGWSYEPGYVERSYRSCADDPAGTAPKTYDLCWSGPIVTLSLNGASYPLVYDSAKSVWKSAGSDSNLLIEPLTGAANGDNDGEYWRVTDENGTKYYFGLTYGPGRTTQAGTGSTWTVPVYGAHSGEPCYSASGFASSRCNQAWRWNLDYVEDAQGNAAMYYYTPETNNYGPNNTTTATPYTRGGNLQRIEYGLRNASGSIYATAAPFQVVFSTTERCFATGSFTCDPALFTAANAAMWPDTPQDQNCTASPCNAHAPTFWSTRRLLAIATKVLVSGVLKTVDTYSLAQAFPAGTADAQLWLNSITRTGYDLTGASLSVPSVSFVGQLFDNRVDGYNGMPRMLTWRMTGVTNETGVSTTVTYSPVDCTATSVPTDLANNTRRCFPVYWTHPYGQTPILDFFHKYVVTQVDSVDGNFASGKRRVAYTYVGSPAWHYDDNEMAPAARRTYGQWRGYGEVQTRSGNDTNFIDGVGDQLVVSRAFYLRGMNGDQLPTGYRSVTVTNAAGTVITDDDWLAGKQYQSQSFNGDTLTSPLATTMSTYSVVGAVTASRTRTGLRPLESRLVRQPTTSTIGYNRDGTSATQTDTMTFDTAGNMTRHQIAATGTETTCTVVKYTAATGAIRNRPYQVTSYTGACTTDTPAIGLIYTQARTTYDSAALGTVGTRGLVTTSETSLKVNTDGVTIKFAKEDTEYDSFGRTTKVTSYPDSANTLVSRTTQTGYTPAAAWPLTQVATTASGTGATAQTTTVNVDPLRVKTTSVVTPLDAANGTSTSALYDPLGRLLKVWMPGRSTSGVGSVEYTYTLSQTQPDVVVTKTLVDNGSSTYQVSGSAISDAFGTVMQTQQEVAASRRVVNDTVTDSHGWVVKTNDRWYTTGAVSGTIVTAADSAIDHRTKTTYDRAGRATAVATYQGTTLIKTDKAFYDGHAVISLPQGATASRKISDARGRTTETRLYSTAPVDNGAGWVTGDTNAGIDTTFTYDTAGRASTTSQGGFTWTTTGYDLSGRATQSIDPDAGTTTTSYNDLGQPTQTVGSRGAAGTTSYVYDGLGRKTEQWTGPAGTGTKTAAWTYDPTGRPGLLGQLTIYDSGNAYTTGYTYDTLGRVTKTQTTVPTIEGTLSGTYTADQTYTTTGQALTTTYTNPTTAGVPNEALTTAYNAYGQATTLTGTVAGTTVNYVSSTTYDPFGNVSQIAEHNPGSTFLSYYRDPHTLALSRASIYISVSYQLMDNSYTRDVVGRITATSSTLDSTVIRKTCDSYDSLGRLSDVHTIKTTCADTPTNSLVSVAEGPVWQTWTYNAADQVATRVDHSTTALADTTTTNTYVTGTHRLSAATTTRSGTTVATTSHGAYDTAGDPTTRTVSGATQTLTYNALNQLVDLKVNGAATTKYVRNLDGSALIRRDTTTTTLYLGGQEFTKTNSSGAVAGTRQYAHAGVLIAERTSSDGTVGALTSQFTDPQGTATVISDWDTDYATCRWLDVFGNPLTTGLFDPWFLTTHRGFLNKAASPNTGLVDMGARTYDPTIGQFLTLDPVFDSSDVHSLNGYGYASHDPVNGSDPSGLMLSTDMGTGYVAPTKFASTTTTPAQSGDPGPSQQDQQKSKADQDAKRAVAAIVSTGAGIALQAALGFFFPGIGLVLGGAITGLAGYLINQAIMGEPVTAEGVIFSIVTGAVGGAIAGKVMQLAKGLIKAAAPIVERMLGNTGAEAAGAVEVAATQSTKATATAVDSSASAAEASAVGAAETGGEASVARVTVSRAKYPESAGHIADAQAAGKPSTLTIDRAGAATRRAQSMRGQKRVTGMDRDEYPPAMMSEGGTGSSVRAISPGDNRGAGSSIGLQCRGLPDGTKVELVVVE